MVYAANVLALALKDSTFRSEAFARRARFESVRVRC
jgi:hypothetical protein